jgi:hypothetical protein
METRFRRVLNLTLILLVIGIVHGACGSSEAPTSGGTEANPSAGLVPDLKPVPEAKWVEATIPKGTPIKISLIDILTSQTSHKGDSFRALVPDAVVIDGKEIVPSGSNVRGVVRDVVPAEVGFKGKGGMIALDFNQVDTPTGASAPLRARLTALAPRKSSAVLAGGGLVDTITDVSPGREAILASGSELTLVLEEPLRIKVRQ